MHRSPDLAVPLDDVMYEIETKDLDPAALLLQSSEVKWLDRRWKNCRQSLEVLVLREFEELSYKEIAQITDLPLGTVMSRLRGRKRLLALTNHKYTEVRS